MSLLKKEKKSKKNARRVPVLLIVAIVAFVSLVCWRVYCNAQYNELTSEANALAARCEDLENEQIQLQVRLDAMADLNNIEQIAVNELGMTKIDQHQIEYVNLGSADRAEVIMTDEGLSGIFRNFSMIWEYLG